jgi:LytS/YehU family sensor histidine kinase
VILTITDSGPGVGPDPIQLGIGLSNCIERLSQLYGSEYSFHLGNADSGGARVRLEWPWRQQRTAVVQRPSTSAPAERTIAARV